MFFILIAIGGLGFTEGKSVQLAVGILLVISTLINMITIGPVCYPIVAETPSGRLRYKTIVIGRFVYNLTGIFSNSVTPRMISPTGKSRLFKFFVWLPCWLFLAWNWGAKTGLFYAGTNLLCLIWCWFRLPETKDRTFGEIDLLFDNHVSARKFKHTRVDRKLLSDLLPKCKNYVSTDIGLEFAHQNEYSAKTEEGVEHLEASTPSKE